MTDDEKSDAERFIERFDVEYAWAYDDDRALSAWFDVSGIPHAVLVGPTGKILWRGHPAGLEETDIEAALAGALPPMSMWSREARHVRKALESGRWDKALEAAEDAKEDGGEELEAIATFLRTTIDERSAALTALYESGDYLAAYEAADVLRKSFGRLPEGEAADEIKDEIKGDKRAWGIAKAQRSIRELWADRPRSRKDIDERVEEMRELAEDFPGTLAAEAAERYIERYRTMRPNFPF